MKTLKTTLGAELKFYEISDFKVDMKVELGRQVTPHYLEGEIVTIVRVNKQTISVVSDKYPGERFAVSPYAVKNIVE